MPFVLIQERVENFTLQEFSLHSSLLEPASMNLWQGLYFHQNSASCQDHVL